MEISVEELLEIQQKYSPHIIDIREVSQYNFSHITSAKNIPGIILLATPEKYLNKTDNYYIYCQYGTSSKTIVKRLNNLGYKTISIIGGYSLYQKLKP